MEITERPPTQVDLPGREEPVYLATQQWALEPWEGEDPPSLAKIWSRKPKFAVNGSRSCAELAILDHLRDQRWHGVWVNSFGPRELRSEWFPAPAAKTLADPDEPETRLALRDVAAAIEARREGWPPECDGRLPRLPGCQLPRLSRGAPSHEFLQRIHRTPDIVRAAKRSGRR